MTAIATKTTKEIGLASRLVNSILAIKPIATIAKHQAREMMIKRAEKIGVPWRENVKQLKQLDWEQAITQVEDSQLKYPEYYLTSFHAYDQGNLSWDAALEVESAARAVHATIWPGSGAKGDSLLRQSYHNIVKGQIFSQPKDILDLGCSVGMSTFALQEVYPNAKITGVDLSAYYLAVAKYRSQQQHNDITWKHALGESTGLDDASFDLVSSFLMFHELPQNAAKAILRESRRVLRPGGYLTIMDMNPRSEIYQKMPPYILTLLKSTEPYLDEYFTLDMEEAMMEAGFEAPVIIPNTPRHRTIVAQAK